MPKKQKNKQELLTPLPEKDSPDFFRVLVSNCIKAYEKLSNDGLALDYCRVADKKLRAMVLNDEEYKAETRNIYARQRLEEMNEIEDLAALAAGNDDEEDEDDDHYEPRDGKKKPSKKLTGADKDLINTQFKAAQLKRELRAEMSKMEGDNERDAINFMFIPITREEFEKLLTVEINEGSDDADIDALIGTKEEVPVGTSGSSSVSGNLDEDSYEILENGEIVEKKK